MKATIAPLLLALFLAPPPGTAPEVIPLWPGGAPGSEGWTQRETESPAPWDAKVKLVRNVVRPTLTVYRPDRAKASGAAVIVAPGGGFRFLSWASEGTRVAEWLARRGHAAFVLKYRTIDTGATEKEFVANVNAMMDRLGQEGPSSRDILDPDMQKMSGLAAEDARQAVRAVRERAGSLGVAPDRIGLLGFSAGAIATVEAALSHDAASRPDFAAPIYGAPMRRVTPPDDAPPLFVVWASDDPLISPVRGTDLYLAWYGAGKPAELHVYATGGHGFGLGDRGLPADRWIERFEEWLQGLRPPRTKGAQ